jgi:hypothetical protein
MATLTKSGTPSLATLTPPAANQIKAIMAADGAAGDMVYINSSGLFALATGAADTAPAKSVGMLAKAAKSGQPGTALFGVQFRYATGLTPGARYYVSATAGALDDAATTGGTVPVALAVDAEIIYVLPPTR